MNYLIHSIRCEKKLDGSLLDKPFIHSINLKAASCSVTTSIAKHLGIAIHRWPNRAKGWEEYHIKKVSNQDIFHFAIVRNPYERLVSLWKMSYSRYEFNDWISNIHKINDIHLNSQLTNLIPLPHFVGRVETINRDWKIIQSVTDLPDIEHLNKTNHATTKKLYNENSREIVFNRYKEEFKLFGYSESLV